MTTNAPLRVTVLMGGPDQEHAISLASGAAVTAAVLATAAASLVLAAAEAALPAAGRCPRGVELAASQPYDARPHRRVVR